MRNALHVVGFPRGGRALRWMAAAALWVFLGAPWAPPPAWAATSSAFVLSEVELLFQTGRPDITVPKNFPALRVYARATFQGSGLFDALWVVDGRIIGVVTEAVMFGETLLFATPRQPPVPTYEPGIHRVTLQVRTPQVAGRIAAITYFVTADEFVDPSPPAR